MSEPLTRLPPWINHYLGPKSVRPGMLSVECWCQTNTVFATPEEIRRGETRPCGRAGCEPPERR